LPIFFVGIVFFRNIHLTEVVEIMVLAWIVLLPFFNVLNYKKKNIRKHYFITFENFFDFSANSC